MEKLIPESQTEELRDIYLDMLTYKFESMRLMVTVDTVFFHEFFMFSTENYSDSEEYTFINNDITESQIWRDLLLIRNQIPMSFLKRIINIPKESPDFNEEDLLKCLKYFVLVNNPFFITRLDEWRQGYKNLLHLKCKDNETKPTQGGNLTLSIYSIAYMFGAHGNQLNNLESQINL